VTAERREAKLIGYALGLFDRDAREELKTVGEIRNKFAHTIAPVNFNDGLIAKLCDNLIYPRLYAQVFGEQCISREKYLHSC
jgi:hypothetical protein